MKLMFAPLALVPLLLTGCASSGGYTSSQPSTGSAGYAYPVGYYDGPYYDSAPVVAAAPLPAPPSVAVAYSDAGGNYRHDYQHPDNDSHVTDANHSSSHNAQVASVSNSAHLAPPTTSKSRTASASSGSIKTGGEKARTSTALAGVDNRGL